jgi:arylsulfatase A-like enzyme
MRTMNLLCRLVILTAVYCAAAVGYLIATDFDTSRLAIAADEPADASPETLQKIGEVLPIEPPSRPPITEIDYRKVPPPKRFEVKPPKGAPNVIIVLMDQLSYADPTTFGGPIRMPTLDRLAKDGLTYTNFHVNALCSPTRISLLTGRNQHQASISAVVDASTSYPGDTGARPDSVATIGEILRSWGYVTAFFGKSHEVPPYEYNVSGPFNHWPARTGFDKFFGYIAGEQSSLAPNLVDGTTRIGTPHGDPNYHFNTDMTNQAIAWVQATRSLTPDRPFLMYYSSSGGHPPHTPPKDWLEKGLYKGEFGQGWDVLREQILTRQKKLGIVAPNTKLAQNPAYITRWNTLSPDAKKVLTREMEVYATLVESADYQVGRLMQALQGLGVADNTLVFYITGDNGGSSIGEINGTFNEWSALNGAPEDIPYLLKRLPEYGGPKSYPNYSVGWAVAGSTPATWCIQMPFGGGNMAGMVVHWPKGIKAKGEIRRQYSSVIDIAPTILEATGIPEPKVVNGVKQIPMAGTSMVYSFNDALAKGRHVTQYNEVKGNRMIYDDGWEATTVHIVPWKQVPEVDDFSKDKWELYHVDEDFGLAIDVAKKYPAKLKQMQDLWLSEAIKNNVLPLDDRSFQRLNAVAAGRPDLMFGRKTLTLYPGMTGMTENGFINTKAVSYTITAELDIPKGGAKGVILSQAGQMGGWSLYVKDGKPKYAYNWLARQMYTIAGSDVLPEGKVTLLFDFAYDGGGLNKGATGTLYINGKKVGQGRIDHTMGAVYSLAGETADVGVDAFSPVTDDYNPWSNQFTGTIRKITIKLDPDKLTPADRQKQEEEEEKAVDSES